MAETKPSRDNVEHCPERCAKDLKWPGLEPQIAKTNPPQVPAMNQRNNETKPNNRGKSKDFWNSRLKTKNSWQASRHHHPDGALVAKRRATSAPSDLLRGKTGGGEDEEAQKQSHSGDPNSHRNYQTKPNMPAKSRIF